MRFGARPACAVVPRRVKVRGDRPMSMWRTIWRAAAIAAASLADGVARRLCAAPPGVLVIAATTCRPTSIRTRSSTCRCSSTCLNTYDNLYRYQGNPPELDAVAGANATPSRPTASPGSSSCARASSSTTAARSPPTTWSTASSACWRSAQAPSGAFLSRCSSRRTSPRPTSSPVRFVLDKPYAPFLAADPHRQRSSIRAW